MTDAEGKPVYKDYADYMVNHQRKPGIGPLSGWRGADGSKTGRGEPNPDQLQRYIDNGGFSEVHVPAEALYFKHANSRLERLGNRKGPAGRAGREHIPALSRTLAQVASLLPKAGSSRSRPNITATGSPPASTRCQPWYPPFADDGLGDDAFPLHAITQRPAAMYHSWGSQNAWLRQIHGENALYVPGAVCDRAGLEDGDWALLTSQSGEIRVPVRRMDAVNGSTVWTWNAIGKARRRLGPRHRRAGSDARLPAQPSDRRVAAPPGAMAAAGPIPTRSPAKAAWFDLRVSIRKDPDQSGGLSLPHAKTQALARWNRHLPP